MTLYASARQALSAETDIRLVTPTLTVKLLLSLPIAPHLPHLPRLTLLA